MLESTTNRVDYTGNGATDTYSYAFKIFAESELKVTVRDDEGEETTLTLTTDYTVTGVEEDAGGTIVLVDANQDWLDSDGDLKSGYKLTIRRVVPLTQLLDLRNQGDYYPDGTEDRLDRVYMALQQHQDEIDRSVKLSETTDPDDFDTTLPAALAETPGAVVIVNDDGDGFEMGPTADQISSAQSNAEDAADSATAAAASASAAATSATNSANSATSAAASAAAAQASVNAQLWQDVVFKTTADSPITLTDSDRGKLIAIDASGGAVTVNLPQISGLTLADPWAIGIKKTDASGNAVTIARSGTDTIDGSTSKTLTVVDSGTVLIPDTDPAPDEWTSADFGATAGNLTIDRFDGDGSETEFTLSVDPGSENNTWVFISGVYQQKDTYSISGTTLTFSTAPPTGTDNIEVVIGTTLSIGVPSDGTVTKAKFAGGAPKVSITASKTSAYTATSADDVIPCNAAGGAFTVTLPEAASNSGMVVVIKKTDNSANAVTIDGNGAETIDGTASILLTAQNHSVTLACDGSGWLIIDKRGKQIATASHTANHTGETATSYTAFPTDLTVTFTAARSGKYKVSANVPVRTTTTAIRLHLEINNGAGSATTVIKQDSTLLSNDGINDEAVAMPYGIYTLVAGTSYTFNVRGKVDSAGTYGILSGNGAASYLVAAELD